MEIICVVFKHSMKEEMDEFRPGREIGITVPFVKKDILESNFANKGKVEFKIWDLGKEIDIIIFPLTFSFIIRGSTEV